MSARRSLTERHAPTSTPRAANVCAALATLLFVMSGCKKTDAEPDAGPTDDGGVEPPYVEETCTPDADDTFCPAYAAAFCEGHFACCDASEDPTLQYESMALCVQRTTCICVSARRGSAFASGQVTYDAAASAALLARVRESTADCRALPAAALDVSEAIVGTLAEGASCSPTGTDYSSLYACAPGLYCYVTDLGSESLPAQADCRRYRSEGETCDAIGMNCGPGLYCADGATIDDPGVCQPLRSGGAACDQDFQCASDFCDDLAGNTCAELDSADTWCVDAG